MIRFNRKYPIPRLTGAPVPIRGLGTLVAAPGVPKLIEPEADTENWQRWREERTTRNSSERQTRDILAAGRDLLAANGSSVRFSTPPVILGCGSYGCAFTTDDPKHVVKVTNDQEEGQAAQVIKKERLMSVVLPRIYENWRLDLRDERPFYFIVREDLPDPAAPIQDVWYECGNLSPCHYAPIKSHCLLAGIVPGVIKKFAEGLKRLCKKSDVAIGDLHYKNIGVRPSTGDLVIRDFGLSKFGSKPAPEKALLNAYLHTYKLGSLEVLSTEPVCIDWRKGTPGTRLLDRESISFSVHSIKTGYQHALCDVDGQYRQDLRLTLSESHTLTCRGQRGGRPIKFAWKPNSRAQMMPMCSGPSAYRPEYTPGTRGKGVQRAHTLVDFDYSRAA